LKIAYIGLLPAKNKGQKEDALSGFKKPAVKKDRALPFNKKKVSVLAPESLPWFGFPLWWFPF